MPWHAGVVSSLAPVTLVVGPEDVLVERAVAQVMAAARAIDPRAERRFVEGSDEEAARNIAEAVTPTLFGDPVVVVVRAAESLDDAALAAVMAVGREQPEGVWCVVVHEGKGNKGRRVLTQLRELGVAEVSCPELKKGRETIAFLTSEVRAAGRTATPDALRVLYDAIGHDPRLLAGAVAQLCRDVDGDPIDESKVRQYFAGIADVAGYQVADAVWERRTAAALGDLRWAVAADGASVGPAVTGALASGLRAVARIQSMPRSMNESAMAAEIGMPPWKVRVALAQARRWRAEKLAAATVRLASLDLDVKGGMRGRSLHPEQKLHALESYVLDTTAE